MLMLALVVMLQVQYRLLEGWELARAVWRSGVLALVIFSSMQLVHLMLEEVTGETAAGQFVRLALMGTVGLLMGAAFLVLLDEFALRLRLKQYLLRRSPSTL
jgi:hypothetical protein